MTEERLKEIELRLKNYTIDRYLTKVCIYERNGDGIDYIMGIDELQEIISIAKREKPLCGPNA